LTITIASVLTLLCVALAQQNSRCRHGYVCLSRLTIEHLYFNERPLPRRITKLKATLIKSTGSSVDAL